MHGRQPFPAPNILIQNTERLDAHPEDDLMRPANVYHTGQADCIAFQVHDPDDRPVTPERADVSSPDLHTIPTIDLYHPN